jgi:hypothetical protein
LTGARRGGGRKGVALGWAGRDSLGGMAGEIDRKFGVVIFDDDQEPGAGWAAVADPNPNKIAPRRIAGHNELSNDTIWWTNISYAHFFKGQSEPWRNPVLRHDKYLVISQADVLREWGYDPTSIEPDFVSRFCAQVFDRIMRISWGLLSDVNPKLRIEQGFQGKTLREDLRSLLPELEYPKLEAAESMKSGQAWEEFTATGVRGPRGGKWVMLRRPRLGYSMSMLQTPVPKGPYEYLSRGDLRSKAPDRVAYVKGLKVPAMVELSVQNIQPEVAPIYGFGASIDKDKRTPRSWVSALEFDILARFAEVDVRSLYQAGTYWAMVPDMNESVKDFLSDKVTGYSWSAGIVAECLWRAVSLGEDKGKAGPQRDGEARAQTSWQGLWIRAADKTHMFQMSMRLTELGYAVLSYGLGWVRCQVGEEEISNLIRDGLSMGLVPQLSDVPEGTFTDGRFNWPADEDRSMAFARFTVMRDSTILWLLDKVPTLPAAQRAPYIREVMNKMKQRQSA